jgi:hypothetical protein
MKNQLRIVLLVALSISITSCEKIKSIFDVEFDTTLEGYLFIDVNESLQKSTASYSFYQETFVDPLQDEDIAEYEENIKKIKVTNVIATITDVNKPDVVFLKGTRITVKGSTTVTWTLEDEWPIVVGDEIVLGDDVSVKIYKAVTEMLSDKESLTIIAQGDCNQKEVYVSLKVGIDVEVTASPL